MQNKILPIALLSSLTLLSACTGERATTPTNTAPLVNTVKKTPNISGSVITVGGTGAVATGVVTPATTTTGALDTPAPSNQSPKTTTRTVSYVTPEDDASVTFTVAVKDGAITSVSSTANDRERESREWQGKFSRNVSKVVGKKISEIDSLDAIGGASLTTEAFKKFVKSL